MVLDNRIADDTAGPQSGSAVMDPQSLGVDSGAPMRVDPGQSGFAEGFVMNLDARWLDLRYSECPQGYLAVPC